MEEKSFAEKVVFIKREKITNFPLDFEKEKYFMAAKKVYDEADLDRYIKRIEIIDNIDSAAQCIPHIENNKVQITIQIMAWYLGICPSGYVYEYNKDKCKKFTDNLAHELVHAKNIVNIYERFGIEELNLIRRRDNKVCRIAWMTLDEYAACKETAEKYNAYDSVEQITNYGNLMYIIAMEIMGKIERGQPLSRINLYPMNYAIATRCAFADVSGDEKKHLGVNGSYLGDIILKRYVEAIRPLLREYYSLQPLNSAKYQELGYMMMYKLLSTYELKEEEVNNIIAELLE